MEGTGAEPAVGTVDGVVRRHLDDLSGWPRRLWCAGAVAGSAVGLAVAASGHLLAGGAWLLLSLTVWVVRCGLGAQRTEVGPTWIALQGVARSRVIEAREARLVDVVHTDLAGPRLVVRGSRSPGIAVPSSAVSGDAELAASLRRFVRAAAPGAVVTRDAADLLRSS